jgi:hypothetical protein
MQSFLKRYFRPQRLYVESKRSLPSTINTSLFTLKKINNTYHMDNHPIKDPCLNFLHRINNSSQPLESKIKITNIILNDSSKNLHTIESNSLIPFHMMYRLHDWFNFNDYETSIHDPTNNHFDYRDVSQANTGEIGIIIPNDYSELNPLMSKWDTLDETTKNKYISILCEEYLNLTIPIIINDDNWRTESKGQLTLRRYQNHNSNKVSSFIQKSNYYYSLVNGVKAINHGEGGLKVFTECPFKELLYENKPKTDGFMKGNINLYPHGFVPFWITHYLKEVIKSRGINVK